MKTNKTVNIPFMGTHIQQQTEGGLLNIQPILELVNLKRKMGGEENKRFNTYFESKNGQEYVQSLLIKLQKLSNINELHTYRNSCKLQKLSNINGLHTRENSPELPLPAQQLGLDLESYTKFSMADLKAFEVYKDTRKTKNKEAGAWFSPLLALDIVGWLDADIRLEFNILVLQELFKKRVTISDKQNELSDTILSYLGKPSHSSFYAQLAMNINYRVYGEHYVGIRNDSSKEEFEKLTKLLSTLTVFIENGIITSLYQVSKYINTIKLTKEQL